MEEKTHLLERSGKMRKCEDAMETRIYPKMAALPEVPATLAVRL